MGGAVDRADEVAVLLDRGGCPAEVEEDVLAFGAFSSALLESSVAALETADWSLRDFRRGDALHLASKAAGEAMRVVGAKYDRRPPWTLRFAARPTVMRLGLPILSWILPFDLEAYLEEHFTKVGDQTREELADFIAYGEQCGVEVDGLRSLLAALPE